VADDIAHGVLELAVERGLVELLAERALLTEFEQLCRARQAPYMGRQNPVCHFFLPRFHEICFGGANRGGAPSVAAFVKLPKTICPASPVVACAAHGKCHKWWAAGQQPTNRRHRAGIVQE
jgi:hypothetical protein